MTSLTIVVFVWSQFRFQRGLLGIYTECGLYLKKLTSVLTVFVSCSFLVAVFWGLRVRWVVTAEMMTNGKTEYGREIPDGPTIHHPKFALYSI